MADPLLETAPAARPAGRSADPAGSDACTGAARVGRAFVQVAPFDLHASFEMQLVGKFDPTGARGAKSLRKVHLDARGEPVVWRFTERPDGLLIEVAGDDGGLLDVMTGQFPLADGAESFAPEHAVLRRLGRTCAGLRIMRFPWPFDVAAAMVLQQRVRWQVGYADFRRVALRWGTRVEAAVTFPTSAQLAAVPRAAIEALGIDPKRARALHLLAQADARHGFLHPRANVADVSARLLSIPGIGPWTVGQIAGFAYGDVDAVPVGDLHLPAIVTSALAGEPEGTDARMLELLRPFAGHRFRVIRMLLRSWRRIAPVPAHDRRHPWAAAPTVRERA